MPNKQSVVKLQHHEIQKESHKKKKDDITVTLSLRIGYRYQAGPPPVNLHVLPLRDAVKTLLHLSVT